MVVVFNLVQWWGLEVVVLKGRLLVLGYRRIARSLVLRTCFIWRLFIVSAFVSSLVACASHFALFGGKVHAPISTLYLL